MVAARGPGPTGPVLLTALLALGCGAPATGPAEGPEQLPPNRSVFQDYPAMNLEYQREKDRLALPSGVTLPADAPKLSENGTYGVGFGTSRADEFWWCAWAAEWLAHREGPGLQAARAWAQLVQVSDTELYRVGYAPESRQLTDEVLARALAGDPTALAADVERNC